MDEIFYFDIRRNNIEPIFLKNYTEVPGLSSTNIFREREI